ncbi:MAG: DUF2357 domain-containing protein [Clostridia bacterium]|nr:DUF2357 domain-containing protein [Clostridia bacterium]
MSDINGKKRNNSSSLIDSIYQKFVRGVIRSIGSTSFYEFFMDAVSKADNEFQFSNRKTEKIVDLTWVDAIEAALEAFQNIIGNPRNVIKEEEFIVNVENARKGGSEVVRHLATHVSMVDSYDDMAGDVRPGRLMQRYREDTTGTYENRMVFTAMEYAFRFVKLRHDALFEAMSDEFGAKLKVRSDITSASEKVHLDLFLHIMDNDTALETDDKNAETFSRISRIHRVLGIFMNSSFADQMSRLPRIKGQINKTNLLKRNKDYRKISDLFEFLRGYSDVGYSIKVVEQNPKISDDFRDDIYRNILFNYLVLKGYLEDESDRQIPRAVRGGRKRTLKPKVIRQIIEEITEDYDVPDVEVRKVLIEELTKSDLMREETEERRRIVAEREERKKAEAERIRREKEEERERLRRERAEAREKARLEKLAEEERVRQEKAEREIETRRRTAVFAAELKRFSDSVAEQIQLREEELERRKEGLSDYADAAEILERTEQLKKAERERARQRRKAAEEQERFVLESAEREAQEKARLEAEELEKARLAAEALEREKARRIAEEEERLRLEKEAEEERLRAEAEKKKAEEELAARTARDRAALTYIISELKVFDETLEERIRTRHNTEDEYLRGKEEHELMMKERA